MKVAGDGAVHVAIMQYTKGARTTLRIPMGKGLLIPGGESLQATFSREMLQEVADDPEHFSYEMLSSEPVYLQAVPDDKSPANELHLKAFYAVHVTVGELRKDRLIEHDGTAEEETLGPPRWTEVATALKEMQAPRRSIQCHVHAILSTVAVLCAQYPKVWQIYNRLAEDAPEGESPDSELMVAYRAYVARLPQSAE